MHKKNSAFHGENNAKLRLIVVTKKQLLAIFICIVVAAVILLGGMGIAKAVSSPVSKPVVVIDPGHGGIDNGVIGKSGYKESEFNLQMSKELAAFLENAGFKVVLTRTDENGLYGEDDDNKKRADMAARKAIIEKNDPDFVISIHANKFPGDGRRGAQVFFDDMSKEGKLLADNIQNGLNLLNSANVGRTFNALAGDYYMLKCTVKPSVIVECGFMSNAEDEKLLSDAEYRKKLAFAVYSGIVGYCEV